jgi:hypothetical protein
MMTLGKSRTESPCFYVMRYRSKAGAVSQCPARLNR